MNVSGGSRKSLPMWLQVGLGILLGFWLVVITSVVAIKLLVAVGQDVKVPGTSVTSTPAEDTELPQDMTSQQIRNLYGSLSECAQGGQFEFDTCTYAFTGE